MARPTLSFSLLPLVCLGACGGGGGGGQTASLPVSVDGLGLLANNPPANYESAEYLNSTGLAQINASSLYAVNGSGNGILAALIDTGIDTNHADLSGAIDSDSVNINTMGKGAIGDASGHGTAVAGVIAARRDGSGTHGVAFNSSILAIRSEKTGSCTTSCSFDQNTLATATNYAISEGARVVNYSLGGAGALTAGFRNAMEDAVDSGALLVLAAGNGGNANPGYPGLFARDTASDGAAIVVGAVNSTNDIAAFSNRAGNAASNYLVAPGVNIRTLKDGGGTAIVSGTSIATPFVTGAAAAIMDAAPFLSAAEVASLLLSTARDLGAGGTDKIYGRGLLDLDAAMDPQGAAVLPTGANVDGAGATVSSSELSFAAVFGDALVGKLGTVMMLDGYKRGYELNAQQFVPQHDSSIDLEQLLQPDRYDASEAGLGDNLSLSLRARNPEGGNSVIGNSFAKFGQQENLNQRNDPARSHASLFLVGENNRELTDLNLRSEGFEGGDFSLGFGGGSPLDSWANDDGREWTPSLLSDQLDQENLWQRDDWLHLDASTTLNDGWQVGARMAGSLSSNGEPEQQSSEIDELATQQFSVFVGQRDARAFSWQIEAGQVVEKGGFLDSYGSGAFGSDIESQSHFLRLLMRQPVGQSISLFAEANLVRTEAEINGSGLIDELSPVTSSSFKTGLSVDGFLHGNDRLTAAFAMPHRIEAGDITLDLPKARTFDGQVIRKQEKAGLQPSGREKDLILSYGLNVNDSLTLESHAMLRIEPGHVATAPPEAVGLVRMKYRFGND